MRRKLALTFTCALLLVALTACDAVMITNVRDGQIVSSPTVHVTGNLPADAPPGGTLKVNGIPTTVAADRSWVQDVPTDQAHRTTVVEALYLDPSNVDWRERKLVVNGPSIADGAYSPDGVGMRFTNTGLASMGPIVKQLSAGAFDIGSLLMGQNPIINNEPVFLTFKASGSVKEAGIGDVDIATKSTTGGVNAKIAIKNLYVGLDLHITDNLLINLDCGLELNIANTTIDANFDLKPLAGDESHVDVNLLGSPAVTTEGVTYSFISGVCDSDTFVIGDIVNSLAGPKIQGMVSSSFSTKLGDPDGAGPQDSPIADAIETALANISIAGSVGEATKANLRAPFTSITEGSSAIDMRANADFFPTFGTGPSDCQPPPGAPDLKETFDVPGPPPTLGDTTPSGQPYGLGLTISASTFNQLLSTMTECGLMNRNVTTINLGGQDLPLTSTLLSGLAPTFGKLAANTPMTIRVAPTVGPFVTSGSGPNGEMGELYLADLHLEFHATINGYDINLATLAVDSPLGLQLAFDPVAGQLAPTITPGPASSVRATVVTNLIGLDEGSIQLIFPTLFPQFVSGLSSSFAAFPLPSFLGLGLNVKQVARSGQYFVLYSDLNTVPQTRLENVAVTDLSTADSADDDTVSDSNEWRHKIRPTITGNSASVAYKAMLGADACCFVDDEAKSAKGSYRMTFDVVPENGETWKLNIGQSIAGAHTMNDEGGGGASSQFNGPVIGRVKVGSGAFQTFNFTPSVPSASHPRSSSSGNTSAGFTGSASTVLTGNTRQTITVEFEINMSVLSDSTVFPPVSGDEVALRLGANDTLANGFTAGEYPGIGNRNILTDGHFGTVQLSVV